MSDMYSIDLARPGSGLISGHLHMGGVNPAGEKIEANSSYLTRGGHPWLPVMGEMHYTRYPAAEWRTELLKMKMGGIQVAATYVFWIHHEEIEGQFDWSGQRNLREFIQTCAECGLLVYPRIGPWAHGECRNGGFPDWLLAQCGKQVRQDAPQYLTYAHRFYREIAHQLDGLLWKDGGPVIGVQIENELLNNAAHLLTLKRMACEVGLDVPLYTQTGWGPAELTADELLPVFGGYPDTFWDRHVDTWARASRNQFFFSPDRDENTIGADLQQSTIASNAERTAQLLRYPYGTCENGGGMTPAYHRRPMIRANDVGALAMVKIGNGSNLQGYYMYHGGSNPQGQCSTLQESQATGYPNDLPVISYDFQAPLREFGQVNDSYHELRLLHLLLADFGERLAPLPSSMPTVVPDSIDDRRTLRWAARSDGKRAFIFVNNYQRLEELSEHTAVQFQLRLRDETICLPSRPVHVAVGACFCWPVNFDIDGLELTYASAQPVCRVMTGEGPLYVFAAQPEIEPEFAFASGVLAETGGTEHNQETVGALTVLCGLQPGPGCLLTLRGTAGQRVRLLILRQDEALRLYKADFDGAERILLSPACLFVDGENIHLRSRQPADHWLAIYPDSPAGLHCGDRAVADEQLGVFTRYAIPVPRRIYEQVATRVQVAAPAKPVRTGPAGVATTPEEADWDVAETWQVKIPAEALEDASEAYLVVDYVGDTARAYLDEHLVADDFYYGRKWEIGLRRFAPKVLEQGMTLRFLPLHRDAPVYIEEGFRPDFGGGESFIHIRDVRIEVESERCLRLPGCPA